MNNKVIFKITIFVFSILALNVACDSNKQTEQKQNVEPEANNSMNLRLAQEEIVRSYVNGKNEKGIIGPTFKDLLLHEIENISPDLIADPVAANMYKYMLENNLKEDILKSTYVIKSVCTDKSNTSVNATAYINDFGGQVCINAKLIAAKTNRLLTKRELVALLIHEHSHHFGFEDSEYSLMNAFLHLNLKKGAVLRIRVRDDLSVDMPSLSFNELPEGYFRSFEDRWDEAFFSSSDDGVNPYDQLKREIYREQFRTIYREKNIVTWKWSSFDSVIPSVSRYICELSKDVLEEVLMDAQFKYQLTSKNNLLVLSYSHILTLNEGRGRTVRLEFSNSFENKNNYDRRFYVYCKEFSPNDGLIDVVNDELQFDTSDIVSILSPFFVIP